MMLSILVGSTLGIALGKISSDKLIKKPRSRINFELRYQKRKQFLLELDDCVTRLVTYSVKSKKTQEDIAVMDDAHFRLCTYFAPLAKVYLSQTTLADPIGELINTAQRIYEADELKTNLDQLLDHYEEIVKKLSIKMLLWI